MSSFIHSFTLSTNSEHSQTDWKFLEVQELNTLVSKMLWVKWCSPQQTGPPKPAIGTLFGARVFIDITKLKILRGDHSGLPKWALHPMTHVLRKRQKKSRHREGTGSWSDGVMLPQARVLSVLVSYC